MTAHDFVAVCADKQNSDEIASVSFEGFAFNVCAFSEFSERDSFSPQEILENIGIISRIADSLLADFESSSLSLSQEYGAGAGSFRQHRS